MTAKVLAIFLAVVCFSDAARAAPELVLNASQNAPYTTKDGKGLLDRIVVEMFRRIGVKARVQVYRASERSLINSNEGLDDGEASRIGGIEKKYTNLVPVPVSLMEINFVALSMSRGIEVKNFEDLRSIVVGFIIGWKIFENNVDPVTSPTRVAAPDQLFEILQLGRVDAILFERRVGLWLAARKGIEVHVHEPPLATRAMYLYLHKKTLGASAGSDGRACRYEA